MRVSVVKIVSMMVVVRMGVVVRMRMVVRMSMIVVVVVMVVRMVRRRVGHVGCLRTWGYDTLSSWCPLLCPTLHCVQCWRR